MENIGFMMPLIGGAIGYFTNWLAIKMIFKPYNPKYIGKFKIPFTPGLMAKERYALSNKIGATVKKHVLTDEVLIDAISDKDFSNLVDKILDYFENNENTIEDLDKKYDNCISSYLNNFLSKVVDDSILKEKIAKGICEKIEEFLSDEVNIGKIENIATKFYEKIQIETTQLVLNFKNDTRTLSEVIKEKNLDRFKIIAEEILPILLDQIRVFINKNEGSDLDKEIGTLFKKIIVDSYGKLATAFINPDKLYENGKANLYDYLKDNEADIIDKATIFIDKLGEKEVQDIINTVPEYVYRDIISGGKNIINQVALNELTGDKIIELFNKAIPDRTIRIKESIYKILNSLLNDEKDKIINVIIDKILLIKIKSIGTTFNQIDIDRLKATIEEFLKDLIRKNGKDIVEGFDIDKLVENKINTMELSEMEDIVISVANREIKSITIVGGVLGFIIGFIPLLTSLTYGVN